MTSAQVGPVYKGARLRIENPAAGRASRNVQSLIPHGYKMVENYGSYIVVEAIHGPPAPKGYDLNKSAAANKSAADQRAKSAAAAPAAKQRVWVDGKMVEITVSEDGQTWTTKPVGGGAEGQNQIPSAFDALDGQSIEASNPFLMGRAVSTPAGQMGFSSPDQVMSIKGGVQWLAELSTKDPGAYQAMLQKLYDAGYLSKSDLASAAGKWSAPAGQALALAARDTAVVNTTKAGLHTTLDDFLKSKAGTAAAAEGAGKGAYVPMRRDYQDPETLKAAAKTAAESVLGRQLNDAEEAKLTSHFRSLEDKAYNQLDAAGAQGKNASVTMPGSGQVDHFVDDSPELQQEGANYRAAEYGLALKRLFGMN